MSEQQASLFDVAEENLNGASESKKNGKVKTPVRKTAQKLAAGHREISVSEFFTKNRHLLGFDNPRKALLTTVKEAVDNSLDACEEASIPPKILVRIETVSETRLRVTIADNGPGIVKSQIPKIFAKLLYGSKFHSMKQSRGQQGIGISAAGMYGQLTTGKPTIITSKPSSRKAAHYYELNIDTKRNDPEIVKEEDVDWKEFLHDRPMRPFSPDVYSGWYGYREFSDGPVPGLGSHFIDLVHYITGATFPTSCVCSGGVFTWKDEHHFTCPDHVQAQWIYPEGFLVSYSTNFGNGSGNSFKIFGNEGVMDLVKWDSPVFTNAGTFGAKENGEYEEPVEPVPHVDHMQDWLECIRNRKTPNAPIDAGYQHAVAVIMAMKAFDTGSRQVYDADKRLIVEG